MSAPRSAVLGVPGGQLHYERSGQGAPIIFVHAGIADHRQWNREFEKYAPRATVVRYDRRGFGRSPPANAGYSDVDDLAALLGEIGGGPAVVVGCSNGGRIAIDLALDHPERVRGVLLVAAGVSGFDADLAPEGQADYERDGVRMKAIYDHWNAGERDRALEELREYWCAAATGPNLTLVREMLRDNAEEIFTDKSANYGAPPTTPAVKRLGSFRARSIVLQGDRDEPTMGHIGRWLGKNLPGTRYVPVAGADHLINLSKPELFDASLDSLLS